jgi:hypothetical protein
MKALKTTDTDTMLPKGAVPITQIMLHSAVMIAGVTETTLSFDAHKQVSKAITCMYWDADGQYVRIHHKDNKGRSAVMQLPAAAVKQSLVTLSD